MHLKNSYREKLLHAILFFSSHVKNPSKVKIFKLLYFLDFEHFKETGRSVTNLDYFAYDFGPVPRDLYQEVSNNEPPVDFSSYLAIIPFKSEESDKKGGMFQAKKKPNLTVFTPREQKILERLAEIFRDVDAKQISDISHFKNHPWDRTIKEKGKFARIDYALAIDKESKVNIEDALESIKERKEMLDNFPLNPTIS